FEHDLLLEELEPHIRKLAEKAWAGHQRETDRVARTVVLKLKTADFQSLTRSLTPAARPTSAHELADIACALRDRVKRPTDSRYRLVGVGLAGFVDSDSYQGQTDLFN
ncbi:MAG: DNA polymerase IV, partial [Pseudomonadota bacterium]|nr:DNA polymerase IV [Pseudomonadota bacterium]